MFNSKEQEIIDWGLKNGKTKDQVSSAIANYRMGTTERQQDAPTLVEKGYLQRLADHFTKSAQEISSQIGLQDGKPVQTPLGSAINQANQAKTPAEVAKGFGKTALETARVPLRTIGNVADLAFAPITELPFIQSAIGEVGKGVMAIPGVKELIANADKLAQLHPELANDIMNIVSITTLGIGGASEKIAKEGASKVASKAINKGTKAIEDLSVKASQVAKNASESGMIQGGKEILDRVPRAITRGKEAIQTAGERANLIKNSTPEVANAIKSNLDQGIIDTVQNADVITKNAYKEVLDIAEKPGVGTAKKSPTIISGELASKQYDIISKQKDLIGKQIGDATKKLSKDKAVSMQDSFTQIDNTLANTGIAIEYTKRGPKLNFTGSKYTPAERTKIQELYSLATEGGDNLSPLQIREKDQLFSKLQRESKMEGIGNLIIDTPDGSKSLFSVFRDIYSSKLDTISSEIKSLNKQYHELANATDDIEDSILKTPNFNATKSTNQAEFAKVNLRRIFGEAGSSPAFQSVADMMDTLSRQLGYEGASPKEVAYFTELIRKLYPDIVPATGFQGGIKSAIKGGIPGMVSKVLETGAPGLKDQQKALRDLIESLTKNKAPSF